MNLTEYTDEDVEDDDYIFDDDFYDEVLEGIGAL